MVDAHGSKRKRRRRRGKGGNDDDDDTGALVAAGGDVDAVSVPQLLVATQEMCCR
jgi:hypothetical protein